jgi:hypothetical protein
VYLAGTKVKLLLTKKIHMLLRADVYLAGTFGMGLYGLFISNASNDLPSGSDRALQGSSLFGMFALKVIRIPANHPTSSDA